MTIGIDISQVVYEGTGVGRYVQEMVRHLLKVNTKNKYVLFGSSLRKQKIIREFFNSLQVNPEYVSLKLFPFPPSFLDVLWNQLHIVSIERFIGPIDVFWSSDWTQPPLLKAKGVTTIHDLSTLRFPESFDVKIISVHNRKLIRSKATCSIFFCDSEATKKDIETLLGIPNEMIRVIYPGYTH